MIIQGENKPITLYAENPLDIVDIKAKLFRGAGELLMAWETEDIQIGDAEISLPLTEENTLALENGAAYLEVKWKDSNGIITSADRIPVTISDRSDHTAFGGD